MATMATSPVTTKATLGRRLFMFAGKSSTYIIVEFIESRDLDNVRKKSPTRAEWSNPEANRLAARLGRAATGMNSLSLVE